MRQVVVETKIDALRIVRGHTVAAEVIDAKRLLHAEYGLEAADPAIESTEGLRAVVGFGPVALCMLAACVLGAQAEGSCFGFPPDVGSDEVLLRALQ